MTNVGGGGGGASSFQSQSSKTSEITEIQSGDSFGFGELSQVVGSAGRKKRELPEPAHGSSSSFIDTLFRRKRSHADK